MQRLIRRLVPIPAAGNVVSLVLYRGPGCGLCTEAEALVQPLINRGLVTIQYRDVTDGAEDSRRYLLEIPVIEAPNGALIKWPFTSTDIDRLVESAR